LIQQDEIVKTSPEAGFSMAKRGQVCRNHAKQNRISLMRLNEPCHGKPPFA
jgi:hypothetical protein